MKEKIKRYKKTTIIISIMAILIAIGWSTLTHPLFLTKNVWKSVDDSCEETLRFTFFGGYHHSCGCGSPVGNSDCFDYYSYNRKTNEIILYNESVNDTNAVIIKVKERNFNKLILEFPEEIWGGTKTYEVSPTIIY